MWLNIYTKNPIRFHTDKNIGSQDESLNSELESSF